MFSKAPYGFFCRDVVAKRQSGEVAEWLKAADCKSARVAYVGSNPTLTTIACDDYHFMKFRVQLKRTGGYAALSPRQEKGEKVCPRKSLIVPSRM
jgi:hypothetical protein